MLVLRLSRAGRKNLQQFKLLVQEKSWPAKSGKCVEIIGSYDPSEPGNKLVYKTERVQHYLKNGAEPSDTVARLLKKSGVAGLDRYIKRYTHQVNEEKAKAEAEAKKAAEEKAAAEKAAAEAAAAAAAAPQADATETAAA